MSDRTAGEELPIPEIGVREAWDKVERGEAVVVDVREPEELAMIAVPNAIHIPLGEIPNQASTLPRDRDVLLLCRSGQRSAYATAYLLNAGFPRSINIQGGILEWVEADLPSTTSANSEE